MSAGIMTAGDFAHYPPEGRRVAIENLSLLQQLPAAFAPLLLREIIDYDWRFPLEREDINAQLRYLNAMTAQQLTYAMSEFAALPLSSEFDKARMAISPIEYTEKLTAYLWTMHELDNFRAAAESYEQKMRRGQPEQQTEVPRLCVVVIGKNSPPGQVALFQKLRPHGTYFGRVDPSGGLNTLLAAMNERVRSHPVTYGHWYVDGGALNVEGISSAPGSELTAISYEALARLRATVLQKMNRARTSGVVGPEDLRSLLVQLQPEQMGAAEASRDAVLRHFELSLLTEGSGTQIFSTTFVQWAAREILRRARPLTLMIRYSPRQMQRPMNAMWTPNISAIQYDLPGSLVDADMGAYYTWINLMRLSGSDASRFVAWFEDQQEAMVVAPTMAKGAVSNQPCQLAQILRWLA